MCGKSKLDKMAWSGSVSSWCLALAPHFVNNDYATVEITNRTVCECHEGLAWSQGCVL